MKKIFFVIILFSSLASAQMLNFSAWQAKELLLRFTSASQSIYNKNCSAAVTIQTNKGYGLVSNVTSNLTVNLSSSGLTFYSDANCTNVITSIVVATGTSSKSFYFKTTNTGTDTITATATGYRSATQTESMASNPFVWSGAVSTNWSTGGNWSGGTAPGASDVAVFDDFCTTNCSPTFTGAISIKGLRLETGYTGTFAQAAYNITLGTAGFVQFGGTFTGSVDNTKTLTVNIGNAIVAGGTFTAPTGTIYIRGGWQILNAPSVTMPSNSTLQFACVWSDSTCGSATTYIYPGSVNYQNVIMNGVQTRYDLGGGTWNILGNYTFGDGASAAGRSFNNGTVNVYGNITVNNNGYTGSILVRVMGNASGQTVTGIGEFPRLEIVAGGNNVTLSGSIITRGYTVTSAGSLTTTGSTIGISCPYGSYCDNATSIITPGAFTYNNVQLSGFHTTFDLGGGTWNIAGNFSFGETNSYAYSLNNGTLNVGGDVTATNYGETGSALIRITGNALGQTVTGSSNAFPRLEIVAGANPVTLSGSMSLVEYTLTSVGTFFTAGSTLTINCGWDSYCAGGTRAISFGSVNYNNVTIKGYDTTWDLGGATVNVNGRLTIGDNNSLKGINNGTFLVSGGLTVSGSFGNNGSATLQFVGSGAQVLTPSATAGARILGGNISVNLSGGGTLSLASNTNFTSATQNFTINAGTVNMSGKNLTVPGTLTLDPGAILNKGGGTLTQGTLVNNGTINP